MARVARRTSPAANVEMFAPAGVVVGRVVEICAGGAPVVDFPGNPAGPVPARTTIRLDSRGPGAGKDPLEVLLAFEGGDAGRPVVIGVMSDRPIDAAPAAAERLSATLDGRRLEFTAEHEIVLRCGQGSITLTADGRIVIKGTNLVSRASGSNRIKGASVAIN